MTPTKSFSQKTSLLPVNGITDQQNKKGLAMSPWGKSCREGYIYVYVERGIINN